MTKINEMIKITYPIYNSQVQTWESTLEELVMSHQLIENKNIEIPELANNKEQIKGYQAIQKYIEELTEFQTVWFSCACN